MTDTVLLLLLLAGIVLPVVVFFLLHQGKITYTALVAGVLAVLMMLTTLAVLMQHQRSESPQTAFGAEQQPDATALLLPSTATLDILTPRAPEDEAPSTAPVLATREPVPQPTTMPTATFVPTSLPQAQAIVRRELVDVREGPSAGKDPESGEDIYKPILTKGQGEVLEVLGRGILDDPWVQVRLDGERTGWVRTAPGVVELTVPIETLPLVGWYPPTSVLQTTRPLEGPHALKVVNEGEQDVVIVLAQNGETVVVLYVRAGEDYTAVGIPDGTYEVFDIQGANWNGREFMTDAQRTRWDEPLPFVLGESGKPVVWTLTIDSTAGDDGESQEADPVPESDFPDITTGW